MLCKHHRLVAICGKQMKRYYVGKRNGREASKFNFALASSVLVGLVSLSAWCHRQPQGLAGSFTEGNGRGVGLVRGTGLGSGDRGTTGATGATGLGTGVDVA